jgi:hypothetical protein
MVSTQDSLLGGLGLMERCYELTLPDSEQEELETGSPADPFSPTQGSGFWDVAVLCNSADSEEEEDDDADYFDDDDDDDDDLDEEDEFEEDDLDDDEDDDEEDDEEL